MENQVIIPEMKQQEMKLPKINKTENMYSLNFLYILKKLIKIIKIIKNIIKKINIGCDSSI